MSCDVDEVTERLENELCYDYNYELCSFSNLSVALPTSQLILQPFRCFTYVTAHSPTIPSLYLRHSSFSNHSVASPTSQFILQPFYRFSYVTSSSLNSPGEPPMEASVELFSNIFTSRIETFVIPWDQLLYPLSLNSAAWDLNTVTLIFDSLSF